MNPRKEQFPNKGISDQCARLLLLCGVVAGVLMALGGAIRRPEALGHPPPLKVSQALERDLLAAGAVASVNGRVITRDEFHQALAIEKSASVSEGKGFEERLLQRMIDEELRVQRAVELGLHLSDPRVRMDLASSITEAALAKVEQNALDEETLRGHFQRKADYFKQRGPLHLRQIWIGIVAGDIGEAFNRARAASRMLRKKERFDVVREVVGSTERYPIPDTFISPEDLAKSLGLMALNIALTMQSGEISDPIRTVDGFLVLQLLERQTNKTPDFETSRLDVQADYWSERMRQVVEENGATLRSNAVIIKAQSTQ